MFAKNTGKAPNPPVPITISGLNLKKTAIL